MANELFDAYRNVVVAGTGPNLSTATVKALFVDHADDIPNPRTDDFIDDIVPAARIPSLASAPVLQNKTFGVVGVGVFDADDVTFTALTGDQAESIILVVDTGAESTSRLLAFWDTASGLPLTPNGGDVLLRWDSQGIFRF